MANHDSNRKGAVNQNETNSKAQGRHVMTPEIRKIYCRQLVKVLLRHATEAEVLYMAAGLEGMGTVMTGRKYGAALVLEHQKRRDYCIQCIEVISRHATPSELNEISLALDLFVAKMLAENYRPGLNSAAYDIYCNCAMQERAVNHLVTEQLDRLQNSSSRNGGHSDEK
ncbi:hypothetical protein HV092_23010 [Klebsiella quasipneumoniae]|uniref:hypothetical protein n=1 Tax=Klebsiella quasipneumoniae TaxID=1463165 RepID=UPI0015E59742|nr:hypothetical protein [Klebsiella quasipneumoniae]QLP56175.1 hypothetical protein HV092_01130 [Klebsiella quasipneumoniae]QLP56963.1 hypothetical protein HV092_05405 [Klebsiella quasipneumoniae]QLP58997.1 hypothetical protein HV092_16740 [Klebsiella quasipneumoniae]QLP60143.1 hypothetical protein HV092_23010 [Klebsiella quasipneumoniae]